MKLVNLTPHEVNIADGDGNIVRTIPPTPPAARVTSEAVEGKPIDGIPFVETIFGEVEHLPDAELIHDSACPAAHWAQADCMCGGILVCYYIVSSIVITACPERTDLVRPDTGPMAIRDGDGRVIAVRRLTR